MENEYEKILKINYANIQDKNTLQNMIVEHKAIISQLIKQTHDLTGIKDKEQLERDIILNKMQENMLENTRQIIELKNRLKQTTDHHTQQTKQFQDSKDKNNKLAESQHVIEINDLHKKADQLQQQYKQLQPLQERQLQYQKQIKQLKESLLTKQYEHHDHMNQEEKKQIKENIQLTSENQGKMVEVKKNVYHVAKNIVIEEKVVNQEKHSELKNKLLMLQHQLQVLRKSRNQILDKRKDLKINISINQEELEEYRAVGSLQKAKIKAHKDKIDQMKLLISQEVSKREGTIAQLKKQKMTESKGLRAKLIHLEKQQEEMKIKLEQMKVLAETILLQREEVEQFFIMALENCKKQLEGEREGTLAMGKEKEGRNYGQKVDIGELSAKDKQRILTNLYTKLALGP